MKFQIINDYVSVDKPHKLPREVVDYGVRMVGAPLEWKETQGEGIKVGIIDTGIDLNHEDLQGRVADYYNFIANDRNVMDDNGHGTHVAGIIAANRNGIGVVGVAPKCSLYIAKAFDSKGEGKSKDIANALQWLLSKKVDVINMSFNTKEYVSDYSYLIKKAYSQGVVCVCSAGNEGGGADTIEYPAKFPETISVTAVDINRNVADYSSTGERADIAAPGTNILSTYPGSLYVTLSGTSMAAPLITGSIAILQAKAKNRFGKYLSPAEVKLILDMYADDLGPKGHDPKYGYGVFSFGRLSSTEKVNSAQEQVNTPQNKNVAASSLTSSLPRPVYPPVNPYWRLFNNTMMLKMMGFRI